MTHWDDLKYLSSGASVVNFAMRLHEKFTGPKPELDLSVQSTGNSGQGPTFSVRVSEVRNLVPALRVKIAAEIGDGETILGLVYEGGPFNLSAGELDKEILFAVPAPEWGLFVKECNDATTLYDRELVVTAYSDNGGAVVDVWREPAIDPETDRGRYEAMQRARRAARGETTPDDLRADLLRRQHE